MLLSLCSLALEPVFDCGVVSDTLSCSDVRQIQAEWREPILVQLFVFGSNLAEKCVVVQPQLVHMVLFYFFWLHPSQKYKRNVGERIVST